MFVVCVVGDINVFFLFCTVSTKKKRAKRVAKPSRKQAFHPVRQGQTHSTYIFVRSTGNNVFENLFEVLV
nr:unnamed protein product [Haemonchus contortus]